MANQTAPQAHQLTLFPRSPADWLPLLLAGAIVAALSVANFSKHVLGNGQDTAARLPTADGQTAIADVKPFSPGTRRVSGRVGSLRVVRTAKLPSRPAILEGDLTCSTPSQQNLSAAGDTAQRAGWRVAFDAPVGDLRAVVVDSGLERRNDGDCVPIGASVLMFAGTQLVAIAYDRNGSIHSRLAKATIKSSRSIRLSTADGADVADLSVASDMIHLAVP